MVTKKLDNGLTVITKRVPGGNFVGTIIAVNYGSNNENDKTNGAAHFLEHMMFKGTKTRGYKDIWDEFENVGGLNNASTDRELTEYHVKTLKDDVDKGFNIITDMVQNSTLDEKEFDMEKNVILEEVRMYLDDNESTTYDVLLQKLYEGHPAARLTQGTLKSVSELTRADLKKIYDEEYVPQNMVVAMAGDLDPEEMYSKIETAFKDFKKGSHAKRRPSRKTYREAARAEPNGETYFVKRPDSTQCQMVIGYKTRGARHADQTTLAVLTGILSSRLFDEVREKRGMAYASYGVQIPDSDYGIIGGYVGTKPENVLTAKEVMLEEFEKIKRVGVTQEELERAQVKAKVAVATNQESPMATAEQLATYNLLGRDEEFAGSVLDRISAVTLSDVKSAARKYLKTDKYCTVVVGPSCNIKSYTPVKVK